MIRFGVVLAVLGIVAGCRSAPTQGTPATSSAPPLVESAATAQPGGAGQVAQVVFIGQRQACKCTLNRIASTWAALEQVLAKHPEIEVKKLEQDIDQDEADRYDELKSLMVAPGVYLIDGDGKLIQMLQGELSAAQIEEVIGGAAPKPTG